MGQDPHHGERGLKVEVEHDDLGERFNYPGAPYRMHGSPWRIRRGAPHIGEHNSEVYGGRVGLSIAELAELRSRGVI